MLRRVRDPDELGREVSVVEVRLQGRGGVGVVKKVQTVTLRRGADIAIQDRVLFLGGVQTLTSGLQTLALILQNSHVGAVALAPSAVSPFRQVVVGVVVIVGPI